MTALVNHTWQLQDSATGPVLRCPQGWLQVDLLSDLHLSPATPYTAAALAQHLATTPADAVLILGDLFEVWVGDDGLDDPDSFEQQMLQLLGTAAQRLPIAFLAGNRDFLVGPRFLSATGVLALPESVRLELGRQSLLLVHGDAQCLDDSAYQAFRREVRSSAWQQAFLARPLAQRRAIARGLREASESRKGDIGPDGYADLDRPEMLRLLQQAGTHTLVHGHTHRPGCDELTPGRVRWVLSDWDLDAPTPRGDLLRLSDTGLQRLAVQPAIPAAAAAR